MAFFRIVYRRPFTSVVMLLLSLQLLSGGVSAAVPSDEQVALLREHIVALDYIHDNAVDELQRKKASGGFSVQEQDEYAVFVQYLDYRTRDYCRQLYQLLGGMALVDLPCPVDVQRGLVSQSPAAKTKTVGEDIVSLDTSLAEALSEFDEMLLKEDERLSGKMPRRSASEQGGSGQGTASGGGQGATGGDSQGQGPEAGTTGSGQGQQGHGGDGERPPQASQGDGNGGRGGEAGRPGGKTEGGGGDPLFVDDDIIARQLREAAEKETDPELKKKLWAEYRKYRAGK